MKIINKIIEPSRLLVIWQAPDKQLSQATGKRFVVGEIRNEKGAVKLRYYNNQDTNEAKTLGFNGFTSYPYEPDKEFNGNLVDVLSKRLPPSSRTDYEDYLRAYRIPSDKGEVSPLSLLAYTSGKLAGDGFTFFHTFESATPPFDFTIEIAGFRHNGMKHFPDPKVLQDKPIVFTKEVTNSHDENAIKISYDGKTLGYVPKGLSGVLCHLISEQDVSAFIERINGTAERPNILAFVEVR